MNVAQKSVKELLDISNDIRRGEKFEPGEAFAIAKRLAGARYYEHARRLAQRIANSDQLPAVTAIELRQKWALWTSQNPDAPDDSKHDDALEILENRLPPGARLSETDDPETLGIAGGICKRKWLTDGQRQTLEQSLHYYERGAKKGIEADTGYTAINAAFVLDLLASAEGKDGDDRRQRARQFRIEIHDTLLDLQDKPAWHGGPTRESQRWFWETLAEAQFGLQDYSSATQSLKRAYELDKVEPWERETTARQFAWLARLQDPEALKTEDFLTSKAWGVLRDVYGSDTATGAGSLFAGKLGLALSGGGFRASFFHLGVLAALAERHMLRHVEVLSCVSGGSILGAHYYLETRKLLQEKADREILRQDYLELVERVARDFLRGVQKNIRVRIGANLLASLRMIFQPGYTATTRLADLYDKHLYALVEDDKKRRLCDLIIRPKGDEEIIPKHDNWMRQNKVPILILNATTLNTGHNWQFTATWMGEPPASIDSQIDGNYRLRRMYLKGEAPAHADIRLSEAVAASACVPGLFTPLELRGLYEGITVRLVDGGVHDNQGVYGLLDQNCSVMIISDASGQMSTEERPADGPLGVLLRTTSLLQARIRTASYREIEARRKSGRLKGRLFIHLKRGLGVDDRDWIHCDNPKELTPEELRMRITPLADYGVLKSLQRKIAAIRTDLDAFSDVEAYALMTAGCNMVRTAFADTIAGFQTDDRQHDWHFLELAPTLRNEKEVAKSGLDRLLGVAGQTILKVWRLSPVLKGVSVLAGAGVAGLLLYALWSWRAEPLLSAKGLLAAIALAAVACGATALGLGLLVKAIRYRKTLHQILLGAGLAAAGWLIGWFHILVLNRLFLRYGAFMGRRSSDSQHSKGRETTR